MGEFFSTLTWIVACGLTGLACSWASRAAHATYYQTPDKSRQVQKFVYAWLLGIDLMALSMAIDNYIKPGVSAP